MVDEAPVRTKGEMLVVLVVHNHVWQKNHKTPVTLHDEPETLSAIRALTQSRCWSHDCKR